MKKIGKCMCATAGILGVAILGGLAVIMLTCSHKKHTHCHYLSDCDSEQVADDITEDMI